MSAEDNAQDTTLSARHDRPSLLILGTRGIPACHGGFETFAEALALFLKDRWAVTVACQCEGAATWRGVQLRHYPQYGESSLGSILFDLHSALGALRGRPTVLTLGYNTAIFGLILRLAGVRNIVNMDGIEWRRAKWSRPARAWFWLNERLAALTATHLVADHPEIARHLHRHTAAERITTIPYGSEPVHEADPGLLASLGLEPRKYVLMIARPEPENSVLDLVTAFYSRPRPVRLVMLGKLMPNSHPYHAAIWQAAGPDAVFPGAIYDQKMLAALRLHACLYLHGHQVGGTNPGLVEALGCGCAVLAHDNCFNRWVVGPDMAGFSTPAECATALDRLLDAPDLLEIMRGKARARHAERFTWPAILASYESMLHRWSRHPQPAELAELPELAKLQLAELPEAALSSAA